MAQVEDLKIILKVQDAGGTQVVEKLKNQLAGLQRSANQASKSGIDEVARGIRAFDASGKKNIETLRSQISAMKALREQAAIGSTQFKKLSADVDKYSAALAKAEGQKRGGGFAGRATKTVGAIAGAGVFGGAEGALGAGIGAFFGPGGAVVGGAIGAQVGGMRQALGATAEYEAGLKKLRVALFGVTTSSEEYHEALSFIRDSTKQYAIPQEVLTRQFTKLQASVQGAGGNLEDTKVAFNGIVAAVRATGGSLTDVDAALTATAQVFSKGKVSAEELRQQIGERLPGAFTLFAQSMGKTPAELDKALERGQVSLEDFQKFAESLFERYGETAQEIAKGPESAGDRLAVALEEMNESVGRLLGPIGASFQETFTKIIEWIDAAAKRLNIFFGIGVEGLGERVKDLAIKLTDAKTELAGIPVPQGTMGRRDEEGNLIFTTRYSLVEDRIKKLDAQLLRARDQLEMAIEEQESFDIAQATAGTGLSYGGTKDPLKPKPGRGGSGPKDISDLQLNARLAALAARERQQDFAVREKAILLKKQAAIAAAQELQTNEKILAIATAESAFRQDMRKLAEDINKADKERLRTAEKLAKAEQAAADARFGLRKGLGLTTKKEEVARAQRKYKEQYGDNATEEDLDLIRQQLDPTFAEGLQQAIGGLRAELEELTNPINVVVNSATAIGGAFANAFTSVITGAQSTQEALGDAFKKISEYFLQMATEIIAKQLVMITLQAILKALGGAGFGGGGDFGSAMNSGMPLQGDYTGMNLGGFGAFGRASGGPVSEGQSYLVGERGPELFTPLQGGKITSNEMFRSAAAVRLPFTRNAEQATTAQQAAETMATMGPIQVKYESQVINGVEYVTAEQHRQGMAMAAERGRALTISALQNSVGTRKKVGL